MRLFKRMNDDANKWLNEIMTEMESNAKANREYVSKVVKLVKPNQGRIITFQIIAEEPALHMYIQQIVTMAKACNAKVTVSGKMVTATYPNADMAEIVRKSWEE